MVNFIIFKVSLIYTKCSAKTFEYIYYSKYSNQENTNNLNYD